MTENERKRLDMVYNTCLLYIDLTSYIFSNENIDSINIKKYHKKIKKNTKIIEKIINLKYFKELKVENINIISFFIEYMKTQNLSCDDFSQYIEYFIIQLKDLNYSKELLQEKILNEEFTHNIKTYSKKKFIKWLIN